MLFTIVRLFAKIWLITDKPVPILTSFIAVLLLVEISTVEFNSLVRISYSTFKSSNTVISFSTI